MIQNIVILGFSHIQFYDFMGTCGITGKKDAWRTMHDYWATALRNEAQQQG